MSPHRKDYGAVSGLLVAVAGLSVLVLGLGIFAIWAYVSYNDAQSNVNDKIAIAVGQAKEDQSNTDQARNAVLAKSPYKTFTAPDDYCGLTFQYPQTWSEYWSQQTSNGGDFDAFLNPGYVPPVSDNQQFALRVIIQQRNYDTVTNQYNNLVQGGQLTQSTGSANGQNYERLTGDFSSNIRGDAVIFQCRDKTITVRTDANKTFESDFNALIATIKYNA